MAEIILVRDHDVLEVPGAPEGDFPRQLADRVDGHAGIIEVTPTPEWVEVLQSEPDRIDDAVAAGAGRIRTVRFGALAEIQAGILHGVLLIQWRHIHRRGRWGLAEDILEDP